MMGMTDQSRPTFAPVWPHVHEVPNALQTILPSGRVSVFNRGLTTEELEPLTGTFQTPCGNAFKVVGQVFMWLFVVHAGLWAAVLVLDGLFTWMPPSAETQAWVTTYLIDGLTAFRDMGLILVTVTIPVLAILYGIHFVAWRKWRASVAAAWNQAGDRLVRTKSLPGNRREQVNFLGGRLDPALRRLDPTNQDHCSLVTEAVTAIGRYIVLPVLGKEARRVAESKSQDTAVQKVREEYEAAFAAERSTLLEAENAVIAVETLSRELKATKAEQKIVALAMAILEESQSR
jgi:hypothetical protein